MSDFWARRKAAVAQEQRAEDEAIQAEKAVAAEAELEERSDEELLAEAGLPDPDTVDDPDRIKEFLSSALPQRLKTRALRRLWRINPVLANLDGLIDYGEDFTDAAMVVENMQTVYQVGKGMLIKLDELAEDAAPDPELEDDEAETEADDPADQIAAAPEPETDALPPVQTPSQELAHPEEEAELPPMAPASRRMRFRYEAT